MRCAAMRARASVASWRGDPEPAGGEGAPGVVILPACRIRAGGGPS